MPGCFCFGWKKKEQKSLHYNISSANDEYIYEKLYVVKRSTRGRDGNVYDNGKIPNLPHQTSENGNTSIAVRPILELTDTQKHLRNKSKSYPSSPEHFRNYLNNHDRNIFISKGSTVPLIYTAHLLNSKKPVCSEQDEKIKPLLLPKSVDCTHRQINADDNKGVNDKGHCTQYRNTDKLHLNLTPQNREEETVNNLCSDPSKYVIKRKHNSQRSTSPQNLKYSKQNKKPTGYVVDDLNEKTDKQAKKTTNLNYGRKKCQGERISQNNYTSGEKNQNTNNENNTCRYVELRERVQSNVLEAPVKLPETYAACDVEFPQDYRKQFSYNDTSPESEKSDEHITPVPAEAEDKTDIPVSTSDEFYIKAQPVTTYVAHPHDDSGFSNRRNTRFHSRKSLARHESTDQHVSRYRESRNSDVAEGMVNSLLSSRNPNPVIPRKGYRMSTEYDILSSDRHRQSDTREKDFLINVGKGQHLPPTQDELATDILNKYSSIFVENLKDPIPKDPLNKPKAYNIIPPSLQQPLREQKRVSTSHRKSIAFKQPTQMQDRALSQQGNIPSASGGEYTQPRKIVARPRVSSARQTIMNRRATAYPHGGRRKTVLVHPPGQQHYIRRQQGYTSPPSHESRPLTPNKEYAEPRKSVAKPRISSACLPAYQRPTGTPTDGRRRTTVVHSVPRKSIFVRPDSNSPPINRRQTVFVPANQRRHTVTAPEIHRRQTVVDGQDKRFIRRGTTALMPQQNRRTTAVHPMTHLPSGGHNTHQVYMANITPVGYGERSGSKNQLYKKGTNTVSLPSDDTHSNEYDSTPEPESNTETQNRSTELIGTRCIGPSEIKELAYRKDNKVYVNSQVQTDDGSDNETDFLFYPTQKFIKEATKVTSGNKLRWKIVIKRSEHTGSIKNN